MVQRIMDQRTNHRIKFAKVLVFRVETGCDPEVASAVAVTVVVAVSASMAASASATTAPAATSVGPLRDGFGLGGEHHAEPKLPLGIVRRLLHLVGGGGER